MIHVFCNERGSGKTKEMIELANQKVSSAKGHLVYIDDDNRPLLQLDTKIRFITTKEFNLKDYNSFYGLLCGVLSEDYDVETIFINGLCNIIQGSLKDAAHLFYDIEELAQRYKIEFYINVNAEPKEIPDFVKKYVA